jgi:hypothetical protein
MSEVLIALVQKVSAEFVMGFVPLLCIGSVWVFTHIRIDKQGRRYWYSQKYEDTKRNKKQDGILHELRDVRLDLMKTQILSTELSLDMRLSIYDTYKKLGGNSYIDEYVRKRILPMMEATQGVCMYSSST